MAAHSSILGWRIPWTEEPGRPWSIGSQSQTQLKPLNKQESEQRRWLQIVLNHFPLLTKNTNSRGKKKRNVWIIAGRVFNIKNKLPYINMDQS